MKGYHHTGQKIGINQGGGTALPSLNPVSRHGNDEHNQHFRHNRQKHGMENRRKEIRLRKQILKVLYVKAGGKAYGAL